MRKILERKMYWITGATVGLAGVAMVRLMAPTFGGTAKTVIAASGYVLALAGILIAALSTRDRAMMMQAQWREASDASRQNDARLGNENNAP